MPISNELLHWTRIYPRYLLDRIKFLNFSACHLSLFALLCLLDVQIYRKAKNVILSESDYGIFSAITRIVLCLIFDTVRKVLWLVWENKCGETCRKRNEEVITANIKKKQNQREVIEAQRDSQRSIKKGELRFLHQKGLLRFVWISFFLSLDFVY